MKNVLKKFAALLLCVVMVIGCLSGCGNDNKETTKGNDDKTVAGDDKTTADANNQTTEEVPAEPVVLKMWSSFKCQEQVDDPGDMALFQVIEKACNVEFEFVDSTGSKEAMSVLIGTNTLPDLVWCMGSEIAGGAASLLDQELIVALNEFMDKGWMPNFSAMLENDPEIAKLAQNSKGQYAFAGKYIQKGGESFEEGYMIRQDWLDECGLKAPKTIDEMENVLLKFKEKYGAIGLAISWKGTNALSNSFGVYEGYYLENGEIKYGYYEDAFKDYVTTVNEWINMGIYDPDSFTQDQETFWSKMATGKYGLVYGFRGGDFGKTATFEGGLAEAWVPIEFPTLVAGEDYPVDKRWGRYGTDRIIFVSENCPEEKREAAARVIDFLFSEEGVELMTWGVEGESFEVVNGEKKYTDKVLKNPDGLTFTQALSFYCGEIATNVGIRNIDHINRSLQFETQILANKLWNASTGPIKQTGLGTMTDAEKEENALYTTDISTYAKEGAMQFMLGSKPLDEFDEYQKHLEELGLLKVLKNRQAAYDRMVGK